MDEGVFSLLSLNVWCHPAVGGGHVRQRLDSFCDLVQSKQPDVVMVQELFVNRLLLRWDANVGHLQRRMAVLGYDAHFSAATVPWIIGTNSGLVTFTRAQRFGLHTEVLIREEKFVDRQEWVCNKGFLTVEFPSHNLVFINCHLESSGPHRPLQLAQIAAQVDACKRVVVAGDFNVCQQPVWDQGELYQEMCDIFAQKGLLDVFGDASTITFPSDGACYDHCFTNLLELGSAVVPGAGISDHEGLWVDFGPMAILNFHPRFSGRICEIFERNLTDEWKDLGEHSWQNICFYIQQSRDSDLKDPSDVYLGFWCLVDAHEEQVMGMVGVERKDGQSAELRRMHLDEAVRGRGYGSRMVKLLMAFSKSAGVKQLFLSTPEHNDKSVAFYQKHGFEIYERKLLGDLYGNEHFVFLRRHLT